MDVTKINGNINPDAPVHSTRIRVGRSIDGFGLSPSITKEQRLGVENLMTKAFANLKDDLAGTYFPLTGMNEDVRKQLVDEKETGVKIFYVDKFDPRMPHPRKIISRNYHHIEKHPIVSKLFPRGNLIASCKRLPNQEK